MKNGPAAMTVEEWEQFNPSLRNIHDILAETVALAHGTEARLDRLESEVEQSEARANRRDARIDSINAALGRAIHLAVR